MRMLPMVVALLLFGCAPEPQGSRLESLRRSGDYLSKNERKAMIYEENLRKSLTDLYKKNKIGYDEYNTKMKESFFRSRAIIDQSERRDQIEANRDSHEAQNDAASLIYVPVPSYPPIAPSSDPAADQPADFGVTTCQPWVGGGAICNKF